MTRRLGATLMAVMWIIGGSAPAASAAPGKSQKVATADIGARRHALARRYAPRPPYPMYYGRPVTYAPAPFVPIPPLWGYGWEWW